MELSRKQTELLALGILNKGRLRTETATEVFGTVEKAVAELKYLRLTGYIALTEDQTPGLFIVLKAPAESFNWKDNLEKESAYRSQKKIIQTDDKTVKMAGDDVDEKKLDKYFEPAKKEGRS